MFGSGSEFLGARLERQRRRVAKLQCGFPEAKDLSTKLNQPGGGSVWIDLIAGWKGYTTDDPEAELKRRLTRETEKLAKLSQQLKQYKAKTK